MEREPPALTHLCPFVCARDVTAPPLEDALLYDPGCSADVRLPCELVADNEALPDAGAS